MGEAPAGDSASKGEAAKRLALAAVLRNLRREVTLYFLSDDELEAAAGAGVEEVLSEDLELLPESLFEDEDSFESECEPEPSEFSPFSHPEKAKARRSYVLRRMFEEGMISAAEREQADAAPIKVFPVQDIFRETAPYVTEHLRRDIVQRYGNDRLLNDGLQIYATVDLEREHDAVAATIKGVIEADKRYHQSFR